MQFTLVVMQLNGAVTDRRTHSAAHLRATGTDGGFSDGCHSLFDEMIPAGANGAASFDVPITPDGRLRMAWRQPDRRSGLAAFTAAGKPVFTALFLSGVEPIADLAASVAFEELVGGVPAERATKCTICIPPERPLTVVVPWPPGVSATDAKRINGWLIGLSVAFFERAATDRDALSRN